MRWMVVLLVLAGAARAEDAVVTWVQGAVHVTRAGQQQPVPATKGMKLAPGDRIAATPGADAGLQVDGMMRTLSKRGGRWTIGQADEERAVTSRPAGPDFAANDMLAPGRHGRPQPVKVAYTPTVAGSLDRDQIRRAFQAQQPRIAAVYQSMLRKHRQLAGRVQLSIAIAADGHVLRSQVAQSTTGVAAFDRQVADVVKAMHFPPPGDTVIISYPLEFKR